MMAVRPGRAGGLNAFCRRAWGLAAAVFAHSSSLARASASTSSTPITHGSVRQGRPGSEATPSGASAQRSLFERSEEHTSELQSLMRTSYAVFCLKKKKTNNKLDSDFEHNTYPPTN